VSAVQAFGFQGAEEVFHRSIVVGTARAGHGRRNMVFLSQVEVCLGCVLNPLVPVEGETHRSACYALDTPRSDQPATDLLLPFPAVFSTNSTRYGILQTTCTLLQRCILRETAQLLDTSASPPSSFGQKISQHLHLQLHNLVVPFYFFACRRFAWASLGTGNIPCRNLPSVPSLPFQQLL